VVESRGNRSEEVTLGCVLAVRKPRFRKR